MRRVSGRIQEGDLGLKCLYQLSTLNEFSDPVSPKVDRTGALHMATGLDDAPSNWSSWMRTRDSCKLLVLLRAFHYMILSNDDDTGDR